MSAFNTPTRRLNDRFIPLRVETNAVLIANPTALRLDEINSKDEFGFVNYAQLRHNQYNYQIALRKALLPLETRILNFFPRKKCAPNCGDTQIEPWPVRPIRKTPVIGPPDRILGMPHFDTNICHNVWDCSSNNCLATIVEGELYMRIAGGAKSPNTTDTNKIVRYSVKWNGEGTQIAVGLLSSKVGIWDVASNKLSCTSGCCEECEVCAIEWIDDYVITGCSKGVVRLFYANLNPVRKVSNAHSASIIKVAASCKKDLIATSGMDKTVAFWKFPTLERHLQFQCSYIVIQDLAWHPWENSLLAIAVGKDRVILWNINTRKRLACIKSIYKNSYVDCLTFNPVSGELVVSSHVLKEDRQTEGCGIITVYSNINDIVEELHIHDRSIPYLLWCCEGHMLTSVSADTSICLWDFFGCFKGQKY